MAAYGTKGFKESQKYKLEAALTNMFNDPTNYSIAQAVFASAKVMRQGVALNIAELDEVTNKVLEDINEGAEQEQKVKPLDLSNILKHAFLSGIVAARNIPGHEEIIGPELWVDYNPEHKNPAYTRIKHCIEEQNNG